MLLLFLSLALASCVSAQRDCSRQACYPQPRDLTVGRVNKLQASSTCGLHVSERYCSAKTYHGRELLQCCICDSRNEYNPVYFTNSHRISNVVPSGSLRSWWQSENDQDQVFIQLDMAGKFQLNDVMLKFKSPRPAAMMIERSEDFGRTWKPYQYFADDCAASFPHIATSQPRNFGDIRCQEQSRTHDPSDDQVTFNPLSLADYISATKGDKINNLAPFTNLRINFIKPYKSPSSQQLRNVNTFYAVYELKVQGSCFCHGHASSCVSEDNSSFTPQGPRPMTYGQCACEHHTAGKNCEMCASFYNDQPWKPADEYSPNRCKKCNCNNHSQKCHFDAEVYRASGGTSGGVCDDCQHNTMGNNCEKCKPPFYRHPQRDITAPDACVVCDCDPSGSLGEGMCDPVTRQCRCKENVEGPRCDRCKAGFYGLDASNPVGCRRCACSGRGSQSDGLCSQTTGQCVCLSNVVGSNCDRCAEGFWNLRSGVGCTPCNCDPTNSYSQRCDEVTGQCPCRTANSGRTCSRSDLQKCPDYYYSLGTECVRCDCDRSGSEPAGCDKSTGRCLCRPGFTGNRCDECERARGYCSNFPNCRQCHPCFQIVDNELRSITTRHKALVNVKLPGQAGDQYDTEISALDNKLRQIQAIIDNPAVSNSIITEVYDNYNQLRVEADQINPDISNVDQSFRLHRELDELNSAVRNIESQVQVKREQVDHHISEGSQGTQGAFTSVLSSYQRSGRAKDRVTAMEPIILKARDARFTAKKLEMHLSTDNGVKLQVLKDSLKTPDINPLIHKVCGGSRKEPCTAERCQGDLCPEFCEGSDCQGALQLARKAIEDAERGSAIIPDVSNRIAELSRKLQNTDQMARQIKDSALSLTFRVVSAKDQMQKSIADIKSLISQVKDFLTSAWADPEKIQRISENVLSLKLPTDAATIRSRISTLRDIAAGLPDVTEILADTQDDIETARALLNEAQRARERAGEVEDNVGEARDALRDANNALAKVNDKMGDVTEAIAAAQDRIRQTEDTLVNTETSLQDMTARLARLADQINSLLTQNKANLRKAQALEQSANDAQDTAEDAQGDLKLLIAEYEKLRNKIPEALPKDLMDRVNRVKVEAGQYLNKVDELMAMIGTTEQNLALGNKQLESKSAQLEGYQNKVAEIKKYIESQARYYSQCTP
ncbi:laminin subunit beta-3-like [Pristis pectinata]|uniref:laminin subunit beta-3-like n=1 Tax=Pristis pectinata TaxID=685728 RepID=UPI00223D1962|nr:laminin subunit beta-3-like [Pristis pectinata]